MYVGGITITCIVILGHPAINTCMYVGNWVKHVYNQTWGQIHTHNKTNLKITNMFTIMTFRYGVKYTFSCTLNLFVFVFQIVIINICNLNSYFIIIWQNRNTLKKYFNVYSSISPGMIILKESVLYDVWSTMFR